MAINELLRLRLDHRSLNDGMKTSSHLCTMSCDGPRGADLFEVPLKLLCLQKGARPNVLVPSPIPSINGSAK